MTQVTCEKRKTLEASSDTSNKLPEKESKETCSENGTESVQETSNQTDATSHDTKRPRSENEVVSSNDTVERASKTEDDTKDSEAAQNTNKDASESETKEGDSSTKGEIDAQSTETNASGEKPNKPNSLFGGICGSLLKGSSTFINPFSSLRATSEKPFLLSNSEPNDESDIPPAEEITIVKTEVKENEEIILSEKDCRMQKFDNATKSWLPKPPLDGKVEIISEKNKCNGHTNESDDTNPLGVRIVFYVNRTGKLQLNTSILPSQMGFRNPAAPASTTESSGKSSISERYSQIAEFIGLQLNAKECTDTTLYRIRFPTSESCQSFISMAKSFHDKLRK